MSKISNSGFRALHVAPRLCDFLQRRNITTPTPIQAESIPAILQGRDLVGIAQTGTGKTLAFGLPMAELLGPDQVGLVLAPTRELAQQICETYHMLGVSTVLVVGGASIDRQVYQLRGRYSVIVATPGRLIDHLNRRSVRLDRVSIVVLDEADRMLDMGFAPAIKQILNQSPKERQTLLFSATMPAAITELANEYLDNPMRVETAPAGTASELVEQELFFMKHEEKQNLLWDLLQENAGSVLIFARTRHGARKLAKAARTQGHSAAEIHADRTLAQRREALHGFKTGEYRVLVATDIAARGIDVKEISLVVNYDVPENPDDYIHRIGRTGRAGALGKAITISLPQQARDIWDIEKLLGVSLPISDRSTSIPKSVQTMISKGERAAPAERRAHSTEAPRRTHSHAALPEDHVVKPRYHATERAPRAPRVDFDRPRGPRDGDRRDSRSFEPRERFQDRRDSPNPSHYRDRQERRDDSSPRYSGDDRGYRSRDDRQSTDRERGFTPRDQDRRPHQDQQGQFNPRYSDQRPAQDRRFGSRDRDQRPPRDDRYNPRDQRQEQDNRFNARDRDQRPLRDDRFNSRDRDQRPADYRDRDYKPRQDRRDEPRPAESNDRGFKPRQDRNDGPPRDFIAKKFKPKHARRSSPRPPRSVESQESTFAPRRDRITEQKPWDSQGSKPPKRNHFEGAPSTNPKPAFAGKKSGKPKKRKSSPAPVLQSAPATPKKAHRGWSGKPKKRTVR